MAKGKPQRPTFREWLINKVMLSKWVTYLGDTDETLSARLGIRVDVLLEARARLHAELKRKGLKMRELGSQREYMRQEADYGVFFVQLPKAVHDDLMVVVNARNQSSSSVLRSLIYAILTQPGVPSRIMRQWEYRGQVHRDERVREKRRQMRTKVSRGADQALLQMARNANVTPTTLVRSAIIDLLEGRLRKLAVITLAAMPHDYRKYEGKK